MEDEFRGIVDLLEKKGYGFEGEKGEKIVEIEIPAEMKDEVEKYHNELVEKIVENDDSLMEKYLAGEKIPLEDLKKTLRQAVIGYKLVPVFCGSALKNKGVQFALDAVADYLPSPSDMPAIKGHDPKTEAEIIVHAKDDEPLAALAFKLQNDPFVGQLIYFRVYSGVLNAGLPTFTTLPPATKKESAEF